MQDKFLSELTFKLSNEITDNELLKKVCNIIASHCSEYEITKESTELSICHDEGMPKLVQIFLATQRVEEMSEKSIANYEWILRKFFGYVGMAVAKVSKVHVVDYLYNRNVSSRTKDHELTVIKNFYEWCVNEGYLERNPAKGIKPIKYKKENPKYLKEEELEKLRMSCTDIKQLAIVEFFYSTGCRVGEVLKLNRDDVDFASGTVKVTGKGNKDRIVYLNAKAKMCLGLYLAQRKDNCEALFVTDRGKHRIESESTYERMFGRLGKCAGIKQKVFPHLLRHTNATYALERGMPIEQVQKMLGHVSIDTTLIYAAVANSNVQNSHKKCVV